MSEQVKCASTDAALHKTTKKKGCLRVTGEFSSSLISQFFTETEIIWPRSVFAAHSQLFCFKSIRKKGKTADQSNTSKVLHNLTLPSTPYWPSYVHKHVHVQSIFRQTHRLFGAQCLCNCMRGGQVFRMQRSMYKAPVSLFTAVSM